MSRKFRIYNLIFVLFLAFSRVSSIDNYRFVENSSLIKFIKSNINLKSDSSKRIGYAYSIFTLNDSNEQEIFVFIPILNGDMTKFEEEYMVKLNILNVIDIKKFVSSNSRSNSSKIKFIIKKWKMLIPNNVYKFAPWFRLEETLGLKNYIDFNKKGCIYYTVPSEDKLDDIHMVYEPKDENGRKEFVFTKSGIIPIEGKISWQIQNGWNKFRNFFSFLTKHEEVKNEVHDCDNEKTRLKEKIY